MWDCVPIISFLCFHMFNRVNSMRTIFLTIEPKLYISRKLGERAAEDVERGLALGVSLIRGLRVCIGWDGLIGPNVRLHGILIVCVCSV